jgi:hypothetical protein
MPRLSSRDSITASRSIGSQKLGHPVPGWFDHNIDTFCLDALNDGSFAAFGTTDGHLFGSEDGGSTWHELASDLGAIQHVLVLPE